MTDTYNTSTKQRRWGLLALCLAAFALRLGPLWANRFHPDEALYASWGLLIRTGRDVWLSKQGADKPPLLFYLMAVSFYYVWRSEVAARLLGLIAGTLSVPLVFQIPNSKFQIGNWVAASLMAFSPYAILFSATAFLDPVMLMFTLVACAAAGRGRPGWAGILLGLSAATKLTGLLFLPLVIGFQISDFRKFWLGLLGVLGLVTAWDCIKGGTPFWVQQAINYDGLGLIPLSEVLLRLQGWLAFLPYFFGWPALIAIIIMLIASFRFQILRLSNLQLLLAFSAFYFAIHWLFTFQVWDRYLLGLVPVIALLAGQVTTSLTSRLTPHIARITPSTPPRARFHIPRITFHALLVILLLPPALSAAHSGYPVGTDHGAYDGIDQVADYLRARPVGTVVYDHWLGWEFNYYLWDAQVYRAHFPTPDVLRDNLRAFGNSTPSYVTIPAYVSAQPVLEAIAQAGFEATPVLATTNRRSQPTFTVYRILPRQ